MNKMFFLLLFLIPLSLFSQSVVLNEIMSSNSMTLFDEDFEASDWIELYNNDIIPINLSGYSLSDDSLQLQKWTFEGKVLQPGEHFYLFASGKDRKLLPTHWETIISQGDIWKYQIGNASVPENWIDPAFNDVSWLEGPSGFGYGDADDATDLQDQIPILSIFIRNTFIIEDVNNILSALLHVDYDDGFVAYLNGQEIARGSMGASGVRPAWNTLAELHSGIVDGGSLEMFNIENIRVLLVEGENVISIEVHNTSEGSSDMTLVPYFSLQMRKEPVDANGPAPELGLAVLPSYLHTNFSINAAGEKIYLSDPAASLVDSVQLPAMMPDVSYARIADGGLPWISQLPTPGKENSGIAVQGLAEPVTASLPNGFYGSTVSVELSSAEGTIFYTLNGDDPDSLATEYNGAVSITQTTVLKARAYRENHLPGPVLYHTYLIAEDTDLPIVSLSSPPANLFDHNFGIYANGPDYDNPPGNPHFGANFWKDWERPAHIEFFDDNRNLGFSENCAIAIYGAWSRAHPQKSFSVKFRGIYGAPKLEYPLFPNLDITEYQSFILRNSGNDWPATLLRDAAMQYMVKDLDIDYLEYRPAVILINGEYWGIMNIREKISEHYAAGRHGVDPNNIDMLETNALPVHGDANDYNQIIDYIQNNDMQSTENYNFIANQIDLPEFYTYFAAQIYFNNRDWPGNNIKFWRERTEGSRWRWILYDTDFGFNMYGDNGHSENTLDFALEPNGPGWPNPPWSTLLLRRLLENPTIRRAFINHFADMLNTVFKTNNVTDIINNLNNHISNEMPFHLARWGQNADNRNWEMSKMILFAEQRPEYMKGFISNRWGLNGTSTVIVNSSSGGRIKINSLYLDNQDLPWSGEYFKNNPVTVRAIAEDGYRFVGWNGNILSTVETIVFNPNSDVNISASFLPDTATSTAKEIVINEINYNSSDVFYSGDWIELYNRSGAEVNLSGWIFSDEQSNTFEIPYGTVLGMDEYLVLVANDSAFTSRFPLVENRLAPLGFSLDGGGEFIKLQNDVGQLMDSLTYDDALPWPSQADGGGATLELIDPSSDNGRSDSWRASVNNGSPGAQNTGVTAVNAARKTFPREFVLFQNYPNPFNGTTQIRFNLDKSYKVDLLVYDISGKLAFKSVSAIYNPGQYSIKTKIETYSSGVYFYQILLNGKVADTKKMILIR